MNYIIDKKGKKWLIDGYYLDKKGMAWTLLVCVNNWKKSNSYSVNLSGAAKSLRSLQ